MALTATNSFRIDICRVVCVIMIVIGHSSPPSVYDLTFHGPINQYLYDFVIAFLRSSTPTLGIIAGFLYFRVFEDRAMKQIVTKKFMTVCVPALIWAVLAVLVVFTLQYFQLYPPGRYQLYPPDFVSWADAILGFNNFPVNFPLFFLYDLMVCILLSPIMWILINRVAVLSLVALLIALYFNFSLVPSVRPDIGLGFFVGGVIAYRHIDLSIIDKYRFYWISAFLVGCVVYAIISTNFEMSDVTRMRISNVLRSIGPFALWSFTGFLAERPIGWTLKRIAVISFFVFCMHGPIMRLVSRLYYKEVGQFLDSTFWIYYFGNAVIAFAIALAAIIVIGTVAPRFLQVLSGGRLNVADAMRIFRPSPPEMAK